MSQQLYQHVTDRCFWFIKECWVFSIEVLFIHCFAGLGYECLQLSDEMFSFNAFGCKFLVAVTNIPGSCKRCSNEMIKASDDMQCKITRGIFYRTPDSPQIFFIFKQVNFFYHLANISFIKICQCTIQHSNDICLLYTSPSPRDRQKSR